MQIYENLTIFSYLHVLSASDLSGQGARHQSRQQGRGGHRGPEGLPPALHPVNYI
jgi:hypothetical protein